MSEPSLRPSRPVVAGLLLLPSALLLAPFLFYQHFGGIPHFRLHTVMGVDAGLLLLIAATLRGTPVRLWEGLVPIALAFWAMLPDFIYVAGPYHRDWMDLFLFHVSLDEILPWAVSIEAIIGFALLAAYWHFRLRAALLQVCTSVDDPKERQAPLA